MKTDINIQQVSEKPFKINRENFLEYYFSSWDKNDFRQFYSEARSSLDKKGYYKISVLELFNNTEYIDSEYLTGDTSIKNLKKYCFDDEYGQVDISFIDIEL